MSRPRQSRLVSDQLRSEPTATAGDVPTGRIAMPASTAKNASNTTIEERAAATLKRLEEKDPGLKQLLKKAYGYAVFPSVGKASLVLGGSYGHGAVYERGEFIGHATISQFTAGVQIGGETFTEVLVFQNQAALERLRHG